MFTGLVEEIGQIKKVDRTGSSCRLTIACHKVLEGTKAGDSIAVNGTCLTVTAFDGSTFSCDVTPETMRRTAFSLFAGDACEFGTGAPFLRPSWRAYCAGACRFYRTYSFF